MTPWLSQLAVSAALSKPRRKPTPVREHRERDRERDQHDDH
jgi:hypothetical protein